MTISIGKLLIVFCFLLPTVDAQAAPFHTDTKRMIVQAANNIRSNVALALNISNMHELSWDEDMASKLVGAGCTFTSDPWRLTTYKVKDSQTTLSTEELLDVLRKATEGELGDGESKMYGVNIIHPTQARIACVDLSCRQYLLQKTLEAESDCELGPQQVPMVGLFKDGLPGSACGDLKVRNGLCVSDD